MSYIVVLIFSIKYFSDKFRNNFALKAYRNSKFLHHPIKKFASLLACHCRLDLSKICHVVNEKCSEVENIPRFPSSKVHPEADATFHTKFAKVLCNDFIAMANKTIH